MPDPFAQSCFGRRTVREQRCVPEVDLRAWTLIAGDRSPQDRGGRGRYISARIDGHALIRHADAAPVHAPFLVGDVAGSFAALREALTGPSFEGVEGVVWHHPDGRMCKLKRRDFSLPRVAREGER